jgi:hypothetical protein
LALGGFKMTKKITPPFGYRSFRKLESAEEVVPGLLVALESETKGQHAGHCPFASMIVVAIERDAHGEVVYVIARPHLKLTRGELESVNETVLVFGFAHLAERFVAYTSGADRRLFVAAY